MEVAINLFGNSVDNVEKVCLERGTSDQPTVNIGLLQQINGICSLHGPTVLDADCVGNFGGNIFLDPLSDIGMGFLCHFGRGSKAGSNGPDWFVGNSNIGPILGLEDFGEDGLAK